MTRTKTVWALRDDARAVSPRSFSHWWSRRLSVIFTANSSPCRTRPNAN
jgi:hypothetical protein